MGQGAPRQGGGSSSCGWAPPPPLPPAPARSWPAPPCAGCLHASPRRTRPPDCPAPCQAGKGLEGEELGAWLGSQLLRRRLAVRVDRASYKPLPNSKKLVKFPKRIVPLHPSDAGVSRAAGRRAAGLRRGQAAVPRCAAVLLLPPPVTSPHAVHPCARAGV